MAEPLLDSLKPIEAQGMCKSDRAGHMTADVTTEPALIEQPHELSTSGASTATLPHRSKKQQVCRFYNTKNGRYRCSSDLSQSTLSLLASSAGTLDLG